MRDGAAEGEGCIVIIDYGIVAALNAEIDRTWMIYGGADGGGELRPIRRRDHGEIRNAAHDREILSRVMRSAIEAERDAGMVADQPHGLRAIGDVHADLFAAEQRQEGGEGRDVWFETCRRETGCRRHHVLFGNTELDEAFPGSASRSRRDRWNIAGRRCRRRSGDLPRQGDQRIGQRGERGRAGIELAILPRAGVERSAHATAPAMISSMARASSAGAR